MKPAAFTVHGTSYKDLKDVPELSQVGRDMNKFFDKLLKDYDHGILVAHNGATDFQFLCCDYQRAGLTLPKKLKHTICTLKCLRRFSGLAYRKATSDEWTVKTKKGKNSMSIDACATFVLQKRTPPTTFEEHCGKHHEAEPDVRGIATILFDYKELGKAGLYHVPQNIQHEGKGL